MNCPSCGEIPVKTFHSYRNIFGELGFKKAIQGYFKCIHCGAILKQAKISPLLPKYKKPFYFLFPLLIIAMLGSVWGVYYLFITEVIEWTPWLMIPLGVVVFGFYLYGLDELQRRYWVLEIADPEQEKPDSEKLSATGLIIFLLFAIAALGSFVALDRIIDPSTLSPLWFSVGAAVYILIVIGLAGLILNTFTGKKE